MIIIMINNDNKIYKMILMKLACWEKFDHPLWIPGHVHQTVFAPDGHLDN